MIIILSCLLVPLLLAGLGNGYVQRIIPANYDQDIRPTSKPGVPTQVFFSIRVNGFQGINLETMSIQINIFLQVSWIDKRLFFPYDELNITHNEGESINLQADFLDAIWKPDHYFKLVSQVKKFVFLQNFVDVKFYPDRKILTSTKYILDFECKMDFRYYPFDTQVCEILMGSYFHTINEIRFAWENDSTAFTIDEIVSEQLSDYEFSMERSNDTICRYEGWFPETTACIRMVIVLRRHHWIFLFVFFLPSSVIVLVGWLSFFWPAEIVPGRATLVIRSLLMSTALYFGSRSRSPVTGYPNALDTWMFFTIIAGGVFPIFQFAAVLECLKWKQIALDTKINPSCTSPDIKMKLILRCEFYQNIAELIGQIGLPIIVIIFNLCYWPIYAAS